MPQGCRLLSFVLMLAASTSHAGRRGTEYSKAKLLQITLESHVEFGELFIPAGRHRVSLEEGKLTIVNPVNMVPYGSVETVVTATAAPSPEPRVTVSVRDNAVEIAWLHRDQVFSARGTKSTKTIKEAGPDTALKGKKEKVVEGGTAEVKSDLALVREALARYLPAVTPCADLAHKNRWGTDELKFINCVCPWTEKWRLPKVAADLRVHTMLAKGKFGFSMTVNPKGRVAGCRVWAGTKPPEGEANLGADNPPTTP